ncbi:estradiol 17 beta-dehydrogenase 5-like [Urocitellus parryii]
MNSKHQYVEFNDGHFIPGWGFGTYKPQEVTVRGSNSKTIEATKLAIEAGFRHIDCVYAYQVEEEVGLAIRSKIADGTVKREDIFYTSKVWSTFHKPDLVRPSLEQSLKKLQLDYVDLFLIHFPLPLQLRGLGSGMSLLPKDEQGKAISEAVDLCDTWEAMEKCKDAGLTKSIGVSNFNCQHLEMILNKHLTDQNTPVLLDDPVLGALAKKHNQTPALIALCYQLQRGVVVLVKSFNEKRIKENMQVFEFQLTPEDMKILDDLNRNVRYYSVVDVPQSCGAGDLGTISLFYLDSFGGHAPRSWRRGPWLVVGGVGGQNSPLLPSAPTVMPTELWGEIFEVSQLYASGGNWSHTPAKADSAGKGSCPPNSGDVSSLVWWDPNSVTVVGWQGWVWPVSGLSLSRFQFSVCCFMGAWLASTSRDPTLHFSMPLTVSGHAGTPPSAAGHQTAVTHTSTCRVAKIYPYQDKLSPPKIPNSLPRSHCWELLSRQN